MKKIQSDRIQSWRPEWPILSPSLSLSKTLTNKQQKKPVPGVTEFRTWVQSSKFLITYQILLLLNFSIFNSQWVMASRNVLLYRLTHSLLFLFSFTVITAPHLSHFEPLPCWFALPVAWSNPLSSCFCLLFWYSFCFGLLIIFFLLLFQLSLDLF